MMKVVFCHDGQAISDFEALRFVDNMTTYYCRYSYGKPMEIRFSTECVMDAFVLRLMEDKIPADRIKFYYKSPGMESEIEMEFDECLGIKIPDNVRDIGVRYEMTNQILRLGYAKMKARKLAEKENLKGQD
jgi:hypothetical protein